MLYSLKNGNMSVTIDGHGAQLLSVMLNGHEYLWQGDPAYWEDRSPLLFPFVGRFTQGKYTLHGSEYALDIHGFAKDSDFTVSERTDERIVLVLEDDPATLAMYPFRFRLAVTYTLKDDDALSVSYNVENRSDELMYFGIGGHPGFKVPMDDGLDFEDYALRFSIQHIPTRIGHTPACFLSGTDVSFPLKNDDTLCLDHSLFDDDAIVLKNMADTVTLASEKGSRSVTMRYPDMPYLGIWHAPKTDAPYVCIEPWSSLPSRQDIVEEFSCKSDLVRLPAGKAFQCGWEMMLT